MAKGNHNPEKYQKEFKFYENFDPNIKKNYINPIIKKLKPGTDEFPELLRTMKNLPEEKREDYAKNLYHKLYPKGEKEAKGRSLTGLVKDTFNGLENMVDKYMKKPASLAGKGIVYTADGVKYVASHIDYFITETTPKSNSKLAKNTGH